MPAVESQVLGVSVAEDAKSNSIRVDTTEAIGKKSAVLNNPNDEQVVGDLTDDEK